MQHESMHDLYLSQLGVGLLDLVLQLFQIHRKFDHVFMLHHVPHNSPEGITKQ